MLGKLREFGVINVVFEQLTLLMLRPSADVAARPAVIGQDFALSM